MNKTTAQRLVRETFKAAFDKKRYRDFINELCNGFDESKARNMGVPDAFTPHVKSCQRLGTFKSADGELADVLIVHLTESYKLERTRTALRDFVAHKLKRDESYKEAGLVAFVGPDSQSWRFSFVRMEYETKRDPKTGKIKAEERLTPARRYSYIVGVDEECHTAQSRFLALLQDTSAKPTLSQLEEAFSVESVTKEFFAQYAALFTSTQEALDAIVKKDGALRADFTTKKVSTADFTKKLLGQIVFLYFIQKKGWLGVSKGGKWGDGPRSFMRQLVDQALREKKCFFNDVLEPLFYDTLATDRTKTNDLWTNAAWSEGSCRIPFLNGGLFEPLAGYDWEKTNIRFSNSIFSNQVQTSAGDTGSGILDVFDRYNFTVNEAEPLEKEVAIDPEMLGKVFENLIEENRRKGLGAFYTPREIVHYMCQESLINYLDNGLNQPAKPHAGQPGIVPRKALEEWIRQSDQFAHYAAAIAAGTKGDNYPKPPESIRKFAAEIDILLRDITVCDPAIGSGAFPVGMMTEIVRARVALTPYFNDAVDRTSYDFKRHAIQSCLYGADIDAGAVEIAKLRLWLSLVVDEEDVQQIKPLPNLDYKVVVGNSLMAVEKNLFNGDQFKRLEELKPKFFDESNQSNKAEYKRQIELLIRDLTNGRKAFDFEIYFSEVFHTNGGFDIVIANPPYLGEKGEKDVFRPLAASPLGKRFYKGKMDLFYFFFHLGLDLVKERGTIAHITTNYFVNATAAKVLRSDFKQRATVERLVNFNEVRIFESAKGQHNMITILRKGFVPEHKALTCTSSRKGFADAAVLSSITSWADLQTEYFEVSQTCLYETEENYIKIRGTGESEGNSIDQILRKMRLNGRPLGDLLVISTGIQTGADKVSQSHMEKHQPIADVGAGIFVLSHDEARQLGLPACERGLLKPWFKNSDVQRWATSVETDENLIFADKRLGNLAGTTLLKNHLLKFKKILDDCSSNSPYLHRPRKIDFDGPKIVVPQRAKTNVFGFNSIPWYASVDVYFITDSRSDTVKLKTARALLNSRLYYLWFYHQGKRKGDSLELYQKPLSETPIPAIPADIAKRLVSCVDQILAAKGHDAKADIHALEREIDELVYDICGLSDAEKMLVNGADK